MRRPNKTPLRIQSAIKRELWSLLARLRRRVPGQTNHGDGACPCCERAVKGWLDFDPSYRQRLCPYCMSHPRHRALAAYLKANQDFKLPTGGHLLHVAPESCLNPLLKQTANLRFTRLSRFAWRTKQRGDISNLTFDDQHFDCVICSHVLEHVEDDQKALSEIFRVLKPGGWAMLNVPLETSRAETLHADVHWSASQRADLLRGEDHHRLYGRDYFDALQKHGFRVHRVAPLALFGSLTCEQMNLDPHEELIFVRKVALP